MATLGIQQGATWTLQVLSGLSSESSYWSPEGLDPILGASLS